VPENIWTNIDFEDAHKKFSLEGWQDLQKQFDVFNEQFFRGMLPKVLIISGYRSEIIAGLAFGEVILISKDDPFSMNCCLLHEMNHLSNRLRNINDYKHGFAWIETLPAIHQVLNIDIDIYELTAEEAKAWPLVMFRNYGLKEYFEKSFLEYGEFRPLPTGWNLERSPPAENPEEKTAICKGDTAEDLKALEEIFGLEYVEKLKKV
jgi:hypothetical protein